MRQRECEICGASATGVSGVDLGTRVVVLCSAHARDARLAHVASPEALRELFVESDGRRALLPRRARDERRTFPPRPEGRRRTLGRRQTDRHSVSRSHPRSSES
jgi:hypothetical protein